MRRLDSWGPFLESLFKTYSSSTFPHLGDLVAKASAYRLYSQRLHVKRECGIGFGDDIIIDEGLDSSITASTYVLNIPFFALFVSDNGAGFIH